MQVALPGSILITMKVPELAFFLPSLHCQLASSPGSLTFSKDRGAWGRGTTVSYEKTRSCGGGALCLEMYPLQCLT